MGMGYFGCQELFCSRNFLIADTDDRDDVSKFKNIRARDGHAAVVWLHGMAARTIQSVSGSRRAITIRAG
jgi:hypothetical protein